ncbi:tyrosine-type recombinase/integrase [Brevundimonas sp.]|uniref:tyrosine-type recombinase/integrase n=1 Tax=Brevundimonas sp. TaxID=1871086 RepID=UPI0025CB89C9|nr:tyrosine-type recombinase/integrase [Brevundimonas sp.]
MTYLAFTRRTATISSGRTTIDRFCAHASSPLQRVVRLAAATGLRQGDLISLSWNAIQDDAIVMTTNKRRKQVVVPLTAEAQAIIAQCPKVAVTVLTNTLGPVVDIGGTENRLRQGQDCGRYRGTPLPRPPRNRRNQVPDRRPG